MAKPGKFEYEGLPKPKDKEGFGSDFTQLKLEQPQTAQERMPEGCHYKKVDDQEPAQRKYKY